MQTVVGLFRSVAEANQVKQALLNEGYSGGDVTVIDQSEGGYGSSDYSQGSYGSGSTTSATGSGVTGLTGSNATLTNSGATYGQTGTATGNAAAVDEGVGSKIKHFFQNLTGHDEHTHAAYTEGVSRGGALVAVNVSDGEVDRATGVLRQYGATDIEGDGYQGNQGNQDYANTGTGVNTGKGSITGEQVIPVVEEELQVGKRQVERGGVRVFSRVVSEQVSENVNLHDERVVVDRRAVDRPATEADFRDAGPIEVRATGEEAVVGKTGRVVEEVVVGKTATDRTETINDSVRRTEVDVEPVEAGRTGNTGTTGTGTSGSFGTTDTTTTGSKY